MARILIPDASTTQKSRAILLDTNRKTKNARLSWTGTLAGVVGLEVSEDTTDGVNGNWDLYSGITLPAQPAGSAGGFGIELIDFGWRGLRLSWTFTSGAGAITLNLGQS